MGKGVALGFVFAVLALTLLMGWQARGEVAVLAERRSAIVERAASVKLSLQTQVLELQREAQLALDVAGAQRFAEEATRPRADLNALLDRLVDWQSCASAPKACRALRDALPGARQQLWLLQKKHAGLAGELEKADEALARAQRQTLW
jgi:hypothetical protein